jgi:hypothetical protein
MTSAALAFAIGLSALGEPPKLPAEQDARDHPAAPGHGGGVLADRPRAFINSYAHALQRSSQPGPLHFLQKSTPINKTVAAKGGWTLHKSISERQPPAKSPLGSGNTPAAAQEVRARANATAALGGVTGATAKKSAAALDGAAFKRKP